MHNSLELNGSEWKLISKKFCYLYSEGSSDQYVWFWNPHCTWLCHLLKYSPSVSWLFLIKLSLTSYNCLWKLALMIFLLSYGNMGFYITQSAYLIYRLRFLLIDLEWVLSELLWRVSSTGKFSVFGHLKWNFIIFHFVINRIASILVVLPMDLWGFHV